MNKLLLVIVLLLFTVSANAMSSQKDTMITITPDIAEIVDFSYKLANDSKKKYLTDLYERIQHKETSVHTTILINALKNILQIINDNKQNLPIDSNWDLIKSTIQLRITELSNQSKTSTRIGCNCNNCKFKVNS